MSNLSIKIPVLTLLLSTALLIFTDNSQVLWSFIWVLSGFVIAFNLLDKYTNKKK